MTVEDIQPTGRQLGVGCFGIVIEARLTGSRHAGQLAAVKTLKEDAPAEERASLEEEARILQFLSASDPHPHIVQLLGVATGENNSLLLIEEYCALGNLLDYLRSGRSLNPASSRELYSIGTRTSFAQQIAEGLAYLARRGVVHRDVAARNVLLTNQMICKLCDFGFSRAMLEEGAHSLP